MASKPMIELAKRIERVKNKILKENQLSVPGMKFCLLLV